MLSGEVNRRLFGKCRLTSLSRSGSNFDRVSAVARQAVSKWVISSACKWWWWWWWWWCGGGGGGGGGGGDGAAARTNR